MQSTFRHILAVPGRHLLTMPLALALVGLLALCAVTSTQAQQVYRIVGPDGKVTFSDRPPAETKAGAGGASVTSSARNNPALPYELGQVVSKFPVTLYTTSNCGPCDNAKALLIQRGIPFTEKTVLTPDDGRALQAISGDGQLPFGTIGAQQIKGYSSQEWTQYLDAANYPAQSQLPRAYRNPEPTPLVAVVKAPAAAAPGAANAPSRRQPTPPPSANEQPGNPAGIRF